MKTTILIEEGRVQLVLHPKNDHDKEVLKILERLPNAQRVDLYPRQGGYTGFSEQGPYSHNSSAKDLMIIFDEEKPEATNDVKTLP